MFDHQGAAAAAIRQHHSHHHHQSLPPVSSYLQSPYTHSQMIPHSIIQQQLQHTDRPR